jgi:hypothetical protein
MVVPVLRYCGEAALRSCDRWWEPVERAPSGWAGRSGGFHRGCAAWDDGTPGEAGYTWVSVMAPLEKVTDPSCVALPAVLGKVTVRVTVTVLVPLLEATL